MKPLLDLFLETAHKQAANGLYFMYENPPGSELWHQELMTEIMKLPGVGSTIVHMCAWGAVG